MKNIQHASIGQHTDIEFQYSDERIRGRITDNHTGSVRFTRWYPIDGGYTRIIEEARQ